MNKYLIDGSVLKIKVHVRVFHGCTNSLPAAIREDDDGVEASQASDPTSADMYTNSATSSNSGPSAGAKIKKELKTKDRCTIASDVANFATNEKAMDVALICQKQTFHCNRFLAAARSPVLRAMLYGNFSEAGRHHIVIKDVDSTVMPAFIEFINTDR
eukprot:GHVT01072378.1.p1 GENE.GHVT01072378.1~~GHVT01072378.1.p1  ORF type:complete len:158 (+),score=26.71 GHVT01072378.1:1052-1525(+)